MVRSEHDWDEIDFEDWRLREDEHTLTPAGIAEQNDGLLRRHKEFQCAAALVATWHDCTEGQIECPVPGCAAAKFLQQHEGFQWWPESLATDRVLHLFDRETGRLARVS